MKHEEIHTISARNVLPPMSSFDTHLGSSAFHTPPSMAYAFGKRLGDFVICLILLPITVLLGLCLIVLNPVFNKGPLFFVQSRMGIDCKPFDAIKFRSMTCAKQLSRGADDPLETERITKLGAFLRKSRVDELPQIFNVFLGQMSLIGPRPDYLEHAKVFVEAIPEYRLRLPGISGYAQTEIGYAEGIDATREKVKADLFYIENRSLRMEIWLVWRTIETMFGRAGA